jgi:hypothetical protein
MTEEPPPQTHRLPRSPPDSMGSPAPGSCEAPLPLADNHATTRHKRIAVTTAARTLTDLRRTIDPALYRKAVREAEFRNLALGTASTDHTRSELERAFLRLCRRRRLPLPEVNVRIGDFIVDFLGARSA